MNFTFVCLLFFCLLATIASASFQVITTDVAFFLAILAIYPDYEFLSTYLSETPFTRYTSTVSRTPFQPPPTLTITLASPTPTSTSRHKGRTDLLANQKSGETSSMYGVGSVILGFGALVASLVLGNGKNADGNNGGLNKNCRNDNHNDGNNTNNADNCNHNNSKCITINNNDIFPYDRKDKRACLPWEWPRETPKLLSSEPTPDRLFMVDEAGFYSIPPITMPIQV